MGIVILDKKLRKEIDKESKTRKMNHRDLVIQIRNSLIWFANHFKKEISVDVYNGLWNVIQGIDNDLKEIKEKK